MPSIAHVVYWKSDALLTGPSMVQVEGAGADANDDKGDANSDSHFCCRISAAVYCRCRRYWKQLS
jgi:hypothetical protein